MATQSYPASISNAPTTSYVFERNSQATGPGDTSDSRTLKSWVTGLVQRNELPPPSEQTRWGDEAEEEQRATSSDFTRVSTWSLQSATTPLVQPIGPTLDDHATRVLRAHFSERMLDDLIQIQRHCNAPGAACYADSLLHTMRAMADLSPADPCLAVVMALHDAMAFENSWIRFAAPQYAGAHQTLKRLSSEKNLTDEKVEKAIIELEGLGFDTTPFSAGIPLADFDE